MYMMGMAQLLLTVSKHQSIKRTCNTFSMHAAIMEPKQYVAQSLATGGYANDPLHNHQRMTRREINDIRFSYSHTKQHQSMKGKACFAAYRAAGIYPDWAQSGDVICYLGGSPVLHLIRPIYAQDHICAAAEDTTNSWVFNGRVVTGFHFVGECWFRDYLNLLLAEAWELVREASTEHADIASMFGNIELR